MKKKIPFEELSLQEQKIRIVEDAIAQIHENIIVPKKGTYVAFDKVIKPDDSLKELVNKGYKCEACAKGTLLISCISIVNDVYGRDTYERDGFIKEKLDKWFSKEELDLIETAFEGYVVDDSEGILLQYNEYGNVILDKSSSEKKLVHTELGQSALDYFEVINAEVQEAHKTSNFKDYIATQLLTTEVRLLTILNNILKYGEFSPQKELDEKLQTV